MSENEYLIVWLAYLGASLIFLILWWLMTAKISNSWIKMVIRMPVFALLLTPLHIPIHNLSIDTVYSPAIAAFFIDLIAGHIQQAMYTLPYLVASVFVMLVFGMLYVYCFSYDKNK